MKKFILNNLLIITIAMAMALAFLAPQAGLAMKKFGLEGICIIIIFICQGALLEIRRLLDYRSHVKTTLVALAGAYVLAPVMGYWLGRAAGLNASDSIGFILMCSMTPTIVSGIVMASKAGGERDTAILLTVVLSCIGLFAIPFNLGWTLRTAAVVDRLALLKKILFFMLLPACGGQVMRHFLPMVMRRYAAFFKHTPVALLGLIVYLSISAQSGRMAGISLGAIAVLILLSGTVHLTVLFAGYYASRYGVRIDMFKSRSVAVVCSQKSIAMAIPIWSAAFAAQYPLSIIPAVIFHFLQLLLDAGIANHWAKKV
jgi:predicted Na+-dependent transporter